MPNHIHLIAVPPEHENLMLAIGEAHRRYTRRINFSKGWKGHLWRGRFASYVLDEAYLLACARYLEMNPVRAKLVDAPQKWKWSRAAAHIKNKDEAGESRTTDCDCSKTVGKIFITGSDRRRTTGPAEA